MNKKRAAIITLFGNSNFGNKLQNFALQEILEKNNLEVETLNNTSNISKDKYFNKKFGFIRNIIRFLKRPKKSNIDKQREAKIEKFSNKYIKLNNDIITKNNSHKFKNMYDYFIYGSDQIWNPYISQPFEVCLGLFADKNQNIAYSPSISVNEIPEGCKSIYMKALNNYKCLSCREKQGVELIEKISNRECKLVLDPVFLLDKEDWVKKFDLKNEDNNYLLLYFIGEIDNKTNIFIKKIAKEKKMKIVNLLDKNNHDSYVIDPIEFLQYIYSSKLLITDSFHAISFAMIFNKDFLVLNRNDDKKMFSRIESILELANLKDRIVDEKFLDEKQYKSINYEITNDKLNILKNESREYLKKSIN